MRRLSNAVLCSVVVLLGTGSSAVPLSAHNVPKSTVSTSAGQAPAATTAKPAAVPGISGQGKMRFKVLYTADRLPEEAKKVLVSAHGGFAVDRRQGREETYFALPGAGILQIGAYLKTIRLLDTPENVKKESLHDTTILYAPGRTPYVD